MLYKWRNKLEKTEVQINEEEIGKLPEKRIQNNDSKDDQKPWKQNGEKQESINKGLEELKNKQTETNPVCLCLSHTETDTVTEIKNTLEGIDIWSRRMNLWAGR